MASRVVSIDLVGKNESAKRAIAEVGTASEKAARASAVAFDASTSKIGRGLSGLGTVAQNMGVPFASSLNVIGTHFDKAGKSSKGFGSTISRIGAVEAVAAGAGIAILATQVGDFVNQARESAKIGRQTEAVIKSTGGAANVTAPQVSALADRLSKMAGVDDELIQSGENVLLTFTSIRNEVGKGNDIFDQATTAALDMSSALGTDLQSAVIQVGKALQDPIRGITALRRVGVNFSEAQRDQIKTLVDTGRAMDAQKLILRELNTEFGGSAKAMADPFAKAQVQIENLKEEIGAKLIPVILGAGNAASAAAEGFSTANSATGGLLGKTVLLGASVPLLAFAFDKAKLALAAFTVSEGAAAAGAGALGTSLSGLGVAALGVGAGLVSFTATKGALEHFVGGTTPEVDKLTKSLEGLANTQKIDGFAAQEFGDHLEDLAGSLRTVKGSTLEKGFGLSESSHQAVKDIDAVNDALKNVLDTKGISAAGAAFRVMSTELQAQGVSVETINSEFNPFLKALGEAPTLARDNAAATREATSATVAWGTATKGTAQEQDGLAKSLKSLNDDLLASENAELALEVSLNDVGQSALDAAAAVAEHGASSQQATSAQFGLERSILGAVSAAQAEAEATDKAKIAHGENISAVQIENDKHNAALFVLESLKGQYPQLTKLIDEYRVSLGLIPQTVATQITVTAPTVYSTGPGITGPAPVLPGRATGGPIPGNDSSGIPILAHPGEYVMQKKAVDKYGLHAMAAMNAGDTPRFAGGGLVGRSFGNGAGGVTNYVTIYASGIEDFHRKVIEVMRQETTREGSIKRVRIAG